VLWVSDRSYVAETTHEAADAFLPGYARAVTDVGKERGWPPVTHAGFDGQRGPEGALLIGSPDEVVEKIHRHSEALGGISRLTFQMNVTSVAARGPHARHRPDRHERAPALREELAAVGASDHSCESRGDRSRSWSIRFEASAFESVPSNSSPVSRHNVSR
jgi:hypothetical protein